MHVSGESDLLREPETVVGFKYLRCIDLEVSPVR